VEVQDGELRREVDDALETLERHVGAEVQPQLLQTRERDRGAGRRHLEAFAAGDTQDAEILGR
jgi:hypothetical protein